MYRYFLVVLALAVAIPAIMATEGLNACRSNTARPKDVTVAGCGIAPCRVELNSTAQMTVSFVAPHEIVEFTPKVQAGVLGIYIDYALPVEVQTGCDSLQGGRCPLAEGEDVIYDFFFHLADNYPKISVTVELSLNDATGKFLCVSIPLQVV